MGKPGGLGVEFAHALGVGRGRQVAKSLDQFGHLGLQVADEGLFLHGWFEVLQGIEEILGDLDAAEEFGALHRELCLHLGAGQFKSPNPSAEADEMNGADIAERDHFPLHFALGRGELFL